MVQQWYYAKGERKIGPITAGELKRLAQNSELLPDDLVWREGLRDWTAAKRIRGLFPQSESAEAAPSAPSGASAESGPEEALPGVQDEYPAAQPSVPMSSNTAATATEEDQFPSRRPPPLSESFPRPEGGRTGRLKAAFENSPTTFARSRESQGGHVFDAILGFLRQFFGSEFINGTLRLFALCGQFGLWAGAVVAIIAGAVAALRLSDPTQIFYGIAFAAVLVIFQYAASRLLFVLERWDRLVHAQLGSSAPTDGLSLISLFVGTAGLVSFTVIAFRSGMPNLLFVALGGFIIFAYLSLSMLNLEGMNIAIVPETSPAEEALGLLQFLLKMSLRMTPVLFGTLILLGFFQLLAALILVFGETRNVAPGDFEPSAFEHSGNTLTVRMLVLAFEASGRIFLILGGLLPVVTYLVFVFGQLVLALLASVLAIPARLEQLERDRSEVTDA